MQPMNRLFAVKNSRPHARNFALGVSEHLSAANHCAGGAVAPGCREIGRFFPSLVHLPSHISPGWDQATHDGGFC